MLDKPQIVVAAEDAPFSIRQWVRTRTGLSFFQRDNTGALTIVSLHRPNKLCWAWALRWRWPKVGSSVARWSVEFHGKSPNGGRFVIGPFAYDWQGYQDQFGNKLQ